MASARKAFWVRGPGVVHLPGSRLTDRKKAAQADTAGTSLIELELEPSPQFKKILDAVYELQLDGKIANLDSTLDAARTLATSGR